MDYNKILEHSKKGGKFYFYDEASDLSDRLSSLFKDKLICIALDTGSVPIFKPENKGNYFYFIKIIEPKKYVKSYADIIKILDKNGYVYNKDYWCFSKEHKLDFYCDMFEFCEKEYNITTNHEWDSEWIEEK